MKKIKKKVMPNFSLLRQNISIVDVLSHYNLIDKWVLLHKGTDSDIGFL